MKKEAYQNKLDKRPIDNKKIKETEQDKEKARCKKKP